MEQIAQLPDPNARVYAEMSTEYHRKKAERRTEQRSGHCYTKLEDYLYGRDEDDDRPTSYADWFEDMEDNGAYDDEFNGRGY